jgi:Bacterial HORMA domain family 1
MSSSSYTYEVSFTITHATQLGAKVATDLKRIQRFYDNPSDQRIEEYEQEIIKLLRAGYLDTVTYGYKRNGKWITPTLRYTAQELASSNGVDDDPGKVPPGADINGASFYSFLSYNSKWDGLSANDKVVFNKTLPFQRGYGASPGVDGYFSQDLIYSSGGRSINRSSVKNW